MGQWPLRADGFIAEAIGENLASSSRGAQINAAGSADTKGSYVELVASSAFDATGISIEWWTSQTGGTFLTDIAIGAAGSEEDIIPNILMSLFNPANGAGIVFPITIPAGTRISCRTQCSIASGWVNLKATLLGGGFLVPPPSDIVVDMGTDTSNSKGAIIDPGGVVNTKGAYTEIIASTTIDSKELIVVFGTNETAKTNTSWLADLAIGAGGSEEIILPDFMLVASGANDDVLPNNVTIAADIPSGTRLAMRAGCSTSGSPGRLFDVAVYGVS